MHYLKKRGEEIILAFKLTVAEGLQRKAGRVYDLALDEHFGLQKQRIGESETMWKKRSRRWRLAHMMAVRGAGDVAYQQMDVLVFCRHCWRVIWTHTYPLNPRYQSSLLIPSEFENAAPTPDREARLHYLFEMVDLPRLGHGTELHSPWTCSEIRENTETVAKLREYLTEEDVQWFVGSYDPLRR